MLVGTIHATPTTTTNGNATDKHNPPILCDSCDSEWCLLQQRHNHFHSSKSDTWPGVRLCDSRWGPAHFHMGVCVFAVRGWRRGGVALFVFHTPTTVALPLRRQARSQRSCQETSALRGSAAIPCVFCFLGGFWFF